MHFTWNHNWEKHINSPWKWSWHLPVLPEEVPSLSARAALVFMFFFQPSEFWILSLHTARLFIWHCWCILPSLQAALNLLAKQLAKNTRGWELSPVKQRRELNRDLPKFCWRLICCMKAFPSCQSVFPGKAATTTFSETHENWEADFVHGLAILATCSFLSNLGSRKPPLETLRRLGRESGAGCSLLSDIKS